MSGIKLSRLQAGKALELQGDACEGRALSTAGGASDSGRPAPRPPAGAPDPKSMEVRTKRPRMTAGRAAIVKVLDTYRELNYGLSKIEVQKLAYFLQEAGGPLDLPFVKHHYGPYSDTLRHALNTMEGHFIRGLGDGVVEAEIEPTADALAAAH